MKTRNLLFLILIFNSLFSFSQLQTRKTVLVSDDNKQLYVVNNGVIVYNIEDLSISKYYAPDKSRADIIDLRNGLLLYGNSNSFAVIDTKTDVAKAYELKPTDSKIYDVFLAFNADNSKVFATWDGSKSVQIVDLNTGKTLPETFTLPNMLMQRMELSPDRKTMAVLCRNTDKGGDYLIMWDTETKKLIKKISLDNTSYTLAFNNDGTALALGLNYYGFKKQSKYKISWNGRLDTYPLCIQIYSVPDGKLIKEMPSEMNQIYAISFDYDNPDIMYTSNKTYGMMAFDNIQHKFLKIYSSPGAGTCHLTSYKGHLVATAGYETTIYDTRDINKKTDLYYYTIKPYYFSTIGTQLKGDEINKASLMFGMCYHDGAKNVKWFAVNKNGLYDCSGSFDKNFKWIYFTDFKPVKKDSMLLSKLIKGNDYKGLPGNLAGLLKEEKWEGGQVKALFEYSGLDFEPYLDMFGMKKKEAVVANEPVPQSSGNIWEDACNAAKARMKKDGFNIVSEKSGSADGLTGSFDIEETSALRWYILGNNVNTKLEIKTPKGSEQVSLSQDGSKPLYYSSGEESTGSGSYSFRLIGGEKGYIIAGTKAQLSDQSQVRKMLESQGFEIVFEQTQYSKPHEPITANLNFGGTIAWIAFTDSKCGPIDVGVNGSSKGDSKTENGLVINSGSVFINSSSCILKAVPIGCGSNTTFIIGVK